MLEDRGDATSHEHPQPWPQFPHQSNGSRPVAISSVWLKDPGLGSKMHLGLKLASPSQQLREPSGDPASLCLCIWSQWEGSPDS